MVYWLPRIFDFLGYAPYDPSWGSGERLRAVRQGLGLSRLRLAKAMGLHEETLEQWELGRGGPSPRSLERLEGFLRTL
jgi:transcriptional regulator with XRE-family HTH domain